MARYSIGLDLGGTNLRAAAIDRTGKVLDKISGSTNFTEGREAVLGDMVGTAITQESVGLWKVLPAVETVRQYAAPFSSASAISFSAPRVAAA